MNNWKQITVPDHTPLEDAITTLDKGGQRIVLVTDDSDRLLGTLTDGDVRRALLRHLPLTTPVGEVMCTTPQVAQQHWSREKILTVMETTRLLQLPVVDDDGRVIGLETLHELLDRKHIDNPVFLMAGGFGTRLYPLTKTCPKPMLKVGGKPILELILEGIANAGFHRFFISTHYLPEIIKGHFGDGSNWGVSITYVDEVEPLGTGGALGLLPQEQIDLPLIVMNGDLLTRIDFRSLLDFHVRQGSAATMCVREHQHQVPYGVIESTDSRLTSFVEKPIHRYFINAGIYVLSPETVKRVPPQTRIDMPDVLASAMSDQQTVSVFPIHESWLDIGRLDDFERAHEHLARSDT